MKALLAVGVEPRLALQGYDIAQWDKFLLRLPDYFGKKKYRYVSEFRSRVGVGMCDCL
jgi:hypothetical protein